MKRLVTIIIILIFILIMACCGIFFVKQKSEYFSGELEEISQQIETQFQDGLSPDEETVKRFLGLSQQWEKDMNIFDLYIKHELIDQIERNLLSAGEYYRIGNIMRQFRSSGRYKEILKPFIKMSFLWQEIFFEIKSVLEFLMIRRN